MRIPSNPLEREFFFIDIMQKCMVSVESRRSGYEGLKSYYLFGSGSNESPAQYNKIYPHIDQLAAFMYAADSTRFSINIGASQPKHYHKMVPVLTQALYEYWLNSNSDQVFGQALNWSFCYNTTFVKPVWRNGIHPYMVEPAAMGVLREDTPYTDRQEAMVQVYYMTRSELLSRLWSHPKRDELVQRITFSEQSTQEQAQGIDRVITSATNPTIYGNINLSLEGINRYVPMIAEEVVQMRELWVYDDEVNDYICVTIADPDVVIYDRPSAMMFLPGEVPFVQISPNPQYDYYWGQSEVQRLVFLQDMRNKRTTQIMELLDKQVNPPTALMGFNGILDEKNFALNRAAGLLATDMPNAKVEQFMPDIPNDIFREIAEIDNMFAEASGITSVLQGRGESGVRSTGHASQLARLGSSRAKKRALVIEAALEKLATVYLKLMMVYDDTVYVDEDGNKFIAKQFTNDFVVKVDAHSNSPIFMEDMRDLAFNLYEAGTISKERLIEMLDPPMKQLLLEDLKKQAQTVQTFQSPEIPQANQAQQLKAQPVQPQPGEIDGQ
jgi:hypothetical protein